MSGQDELDEKIAEDYDVLSVVRGSVQRYGGKLRITARIVDSDGVNLWAGTIDGPVGKLFSLHEQVATRVRDAIIGKTADTVIALSQSVSSDANLRYLEGYSFLARRDPTSLRRARDLFKESISIYPQYGSAYLELANTYVLLADYGGADTMYDLAVEELEEGIEKDPSIREPAQTYVLGTCSRSAATWRLLRLRLTLQPTVRWGIRRRSIIISDCWPQPVVLKTRWLQRKLHGKWTGISRYSTAGW